MFSVSGYRWLPIQPSQAALQPRIHTVLVRMPCQCHMQQAVVEKSSMATPMGCLCQLRLSRPHTPGSHGVLRTMVRGVDIVLQG